MAESTKEIHNFNKLKEVRKKKKYINILREEFDYKEETLINCTESKILAVCNAGLSTGLSQEVLLNEALKYGNVKNILMCPGSSVSFIEYFSNIDAIKAYNSINLSNIPSIKSDGVIFLLLVPTSPNLDKSSWNFEELPQGLQLIKDAVTIDEENSLINCIKISNSSKTEKSLKHRNVIHYGYEFYYGLNNINIKEPLENKIPIECEEVLEKWLDNKLIGEKPDQLTVNEYLPGQGIPSHIDTHSAFFSPILSLSLGSDIVMEFKKDDNITIPVLLPRRSLLIMDGEARYCWNHGITPRKNDIIPCKNGGITLQQREKRTSFTFRRVRGHNCDCKFIEYCDSQKPQESNEKMAEEISDNATAALLEKLHVHQVYNEIATHFSETRHKPWPNVQKFIENLNFASILLDIGCGNGKYLGINNKNIISIGCDCTVPLLNVCTEKKYQVFVGNCLNIPFLDNSVDCCICIAVIHHLSTEERRLQVIKEMFRVLTPNGKMLIYVWAKDQMKNNTKSSYLKQKAKNKTNEEQIENPFNLSVHTNRTQFNKVDLLVPWKLKSDNKAVEEKSTFYRFYHVFEEGELENLCKKIENCNIISSYYDQGNWCCIAEKK